MWSAPGEMLRTCDAEEIDVLWSVSRLDVAFQYGCHSMTVICNASHWCSNTKRLDTPGVSSV